MHRGPLAPLSRALGYADFRDLPIGINYAGAPHPTRDVRFLADLTWTDDAGERQLAHTIFDEVLTMVNGARRFILLDMFLFNDLLMRERRAVRRMTRELTDALIGAKARHPDMVVIFITDPCNTAWGGLRHEYFEELDAAGIPVVDTDIEKLRDSSPIYSFLWRVFVRPFGNRVGGWVPSPFGGGRLTLRSLLNIPNMKANHRKTLITDDGDGWAALVTSANPHDASYAHHNVAVRFDGPAVADLLATERAVLTLSDAPVPEISIEPVGDPTAETSVQVLTEGRIKDALLEVIDAARLGDRLSLILFYLADRQVVGALRSAARRGVDIRVVLDPTKDAFGWRKYGIPNRPVAFRLVNAGIDVRWADTHGEQCHTKMLLARYHDGTASLIAGSANFTRRNLENFNLETDVCVRGPADASALLAAGELFDRIWANEDGRRFTVDYERYEERSWFQHTVYWLMETTGISTF